LWCGGSGAGVGVIPHGEWAFRWRGDFRRAGGHFDPRLVGVWGYLVRWRGLCPTRAWDVEVVGQTGADIHSCRSSTGPPTSRAALRKGDAMTNPPGGEADDLALTIFEQSGVLSVGQAERLAGRGTVRGHLRAGRWRSLCHGLVVTHNGNLDRRQHLWAAVLVAGADAVLAGPTALAEAGVRGLREKAIHVLIPAPRNRSRRLPRLPADMPPIRVVRTRFLPAGHLQPGRPPRTTVARAAVDTAVWAAAADGARVALAAACQQGKVRPEEIFEVLAVRRRLPRLRMINATLLDIAGGAQALSEINLVELCRRFHLPSPDMQTRREDASGRIRYLDAYWRRWKLHVEVDGAHHMEAMHWADDMLRQNLVWIGGDRILRFSAALVRYRPALVAGQLDAALAAAGWRP
jgi:very-short-patch-repair endonuclease